MIGRLGYNESCNYECRKWFHEGSPKSAITGVSMVWLHLDFDGAETELASHYGGVEGVYYDSVELAA